MTSAGLAAACIFLCGTLTQAQPTISGIYPNGTNLFQPAANLTFTVKSAAGITNVTVSLITTTIQTGSSFLKTLTAGNGLTISGPSTSETVTAPLAANNLYSATIQAFDANGLSTSVTVSYFDTITPAYTWEAEDWDYTSGAGVSGLFIDNPQTNQYAGLNSTTSVDDYNAAAGSGGSPYRPQGLETENCGDIPRLAYINTTNIDYDIGFGHGGTWANYTRHYPAGTYNVFMRGADGNGQDADSASISVVAGGGTFNGTGPLFFFSVPGGGWQTYHWVPLKDSAGNLATFTADGSATTLQTLGQGGDYNANFYMLLPQNTNIAVSASSITNIYPDGATQFQPSSTFSFNALSTNGIDPTGITVVLTGTNLVGLTSDTTFTSANGLTVSGVSTNQNASLPLSPNTAYSAYIQVIDGSGVPASWTVKFDTISPYYIWEAEDYDYEMGQFIDNPQTNAYADLDGITYFDCYTDNQLSGSWEYRNQVYLSGGLETEPAGDVPRQPYTNAALANPVTGGPYTDYDVGFNDGGNWANYTRHFPAGTFNVYMRGANGGGAPAGPSGTLSLLVTGLGTSNQTYRNLGSFTIPPTGSWQTYVFEPLKDNSGNLVKVTFTGLETTLHYEVTGGSLNEGFYMLMPADTTLPTVSGLYPNGTSLFQATNKLSFSTQSSVGIATNGILVTLNGTAVPLVITGSSTNWNVSYTGLTPNTTYTASILVRNIEGATYSQAVTFDTYQPNNYQWEAEDWDYTSNGVSGLYFDNPQVDKYAGLASTSGVDELDNNPGSVTFEYRPADSVGVGPTTIPASDAARPQFVAGTTDYKVDYFGYGNWANYTRHYPAGTYNIIGRFTEGGAATVATMSIVTNGTGTSSQATVMLGTFNIPLVGWSTWEYCTLEDASNNPVSVTFTGALTTLQLEGNPVALNDPTINAGFFMLLPAPPQGLMLSASVVTAGNIKLSFPTTTGTMYQIKYTSNLSSTNWINLGSPLSGNNAVQSVSDLIGSGSRFYKLEASQ
jgi:hypothetical protein